jgi:hypothetical protein
MKRDKLEKYIGKKVKVTLFDKSTHEGTLELGNGFFKVPKWYTIKEYPISFRCSHVIKLEEKK